MKASGIEQNVRRENKLYSYAEQMAELELRKVSGFTGKLFFGEVGFEGGGEGEWDDFHFHLCFLSLYLLPL